MEAADGSVEGVGHLLVTFRHSACDLRASVRIQTPNRTDNAGVGLVSLGFVVLVAFRLLGGAILTAVQPFVGQQLDDKARRTEPGAEADREGFHCYLNFPAPTAGNLGRSAVAEAKGTKMANDNLPPPTPIEGLVFRRSAYRTVGFTVLSVLVFLFGLLLVWAKVTNQVFGPETDPKQVTWWGLLLGLGGVFGAPILIGRLFRAHWVNRRLVVGHDRIQVVEHLGGKDTVVLQIPFANISELKSETTETEQRVGIDLYRLDDPETFALHQDFQTNQAIEGRHFYIHSVYRSGPSAIAKAIERSRIRWSTGEEPCPSDRARRSRATMFGSILALLGVFPGF